MSASFPPPAVLAHFTPATHSLRWVRIEGGFSGAEVWRGDDPAGSPLFALKAWPDGTLLEPIHRWMARAAHLPFVPRVVPTQSGHTVVTHAGRVWDLATWLPGVADFRANPNDARLTNACAALARLHHAWTPHSPTELPCPAVARRLHVLADRSTIPDLTHLDAESRRVVQRAADQIARCAARAEQALLPWTERSLPLRPCLCDVHHDHVLFAGDAVTGVIDYGAMKVDHVAVDLARLLGDLVEDDDARFAAGLNAYHAAGGTLGVPAEFVRLLDRSGVVCALVGWLHRFATHPPSSAVTARLTRLVSRLEISFAV